MLELTEEDVADFKHSAEAGGCDFQNFLRRTLGLDKVMPLCVWTDAALVAAIGEGFSEAFWTRLQTLTERRDAETLTETEHEELIQNTDALEELDARRLTLLIELARRRNTTIEALRNELGL